MCGAPPRHEVAPPSVEEERQFSVWNNRKLDNRTDLFISDLV